LSKNYQSILRQAQDDPTSSGWPDKLRMTKKFSNVAVTLSLSKGVARRKGEVAW
jgi:hypothetical protein